MIMISPLAYQLSKETSLQIINSTSSTTPKVKFNLTYHKPKRTALKKIYRQYLIDPSVAPAAWRKTTGLAYLLRHSRRGVRVQGALIVPRNKSLNSVKRSKSSSFFRQLFRKMFFLKGHKGTFTQHREWLEKNEEFISNLNFLHPLNFLADWYSLKYRKRLLRHRQLRKYRKRQFKLIKSWGKFQNSIRSHDIWAVWDFNVHSWQRFKLYRKNLWLQTGDIYLARLLSDARYPKQPKYWTEYTKKIIKMFLETSWWKPDYAEYLNDIVRNFTRPSPLVWQWMCAPVWLRLLTTYVNFFAYPKIEIFVRAFRKQTLEPNYALNFRFRGPKLNITYQDRVSTRTYFTAAPGLLLRFFNRNKALKKKKAMKLLTIRFLRKMLTSLKVGMMHLRVRGTPLFLMQLLEMLYRPLSHPYVDPLTQNIVDESRKKRSEVYKFMFKTLLFIQNKPHGPVKTRKKGRIKRKIRRKIMKTSTVID